MRADPSGEVELGEAIGREGEIDRLWSLLVEQNILLSGRRGIGKTTVLRLLIADAPTGWRGRLVPLGACAGASALRAALLEAVRGDPDASETLRAAIAPILDDDGEDDEDDEDSKPPSPGASASNIDLLTQSVIEHGLDERNVGLVLVLDDFDDFLTNTLKANKRRGLDAMLDNLASLTGPGTRVRVLISTNTYLERSFTRLGGVSRTLFDSCAREQITALRPEGGARLVTALLLGESITARDRAALARALADNCDHVPRWIHCAMGHFVARGKPILDGDLERCMVEAVADLDREPWVLRRELSPVLDDYTQPQRGIALSILDLLALDEEQGMTFQQLGQRIAMETKIDDDAISRVVTELRADQLIEEIGGQLRMCGELLRMAWLKLRFM